jgi:hypothetical protein
MSTPRIASFLLAAAAAGALPALAAAQDPAPAPRVERARLAATIVAQADAPEFAAQRADVALQNLAEVVRQLGARVARVDTLALGVTRLPEANGVGGYPPPPYVARYVLGVDLASAADVMDVSTKLSAAGASSVRRVAADRPARGARRLRR